MNSVTFLDTNVFMYAAGKPHAYFDELGFVVRADPASYAPTN